MSGLVWTKEKPTVPGWYWHRWVNCDDEDPRPVRVNNNGTATDSRDGGTHEVQLFCGPYSIGEWCPIPEPKEPA